MIIKRDGSLLTATSLNPNNIWAGSAFEYLRGPSFVSMGIVTPAPVANAGLLTAVYIGAALIAEEFVVPAIDPAVFGIDSASLANNFYIQAAGNGGDRLVSTLRNPTGGTVKYDAVAQIVPSGGGRRG